MSRILSLIDALQSIFGYMPVRLILDVLSHLEKIGIPPAIADKDALRHWLSGLLPVLDTVSEATPTDIDDHAAALVRTAIEDDQAWEALYGLLSLVSGGRVAAAREANMALVASEKTGFDVDTIMEIVRLILKIIDQLQ